MDTPAIRYAEKYADIIVDAVVVKLIEAGKMADRDFDLPIMDALREVVASYVEEAHEAGEGYVTRAFLKALPADARAGLVEEVL